MRKGTTRHTRINDAVAQAVANIIRSELSDPRVGAVVSVLRAEVTTDLKLCDVYVSHMLQQQPHEEAVADLMKALHSARGFIRKRVAEIVGLRHTPEITFKYDDSIAHGMRMRSLISEVNKDVTVRENAAAGNGNPA